MKPRARDHSSLWATFIVASGPAVALGFARFAYALILPPMSHSLSWSLTTAGMMNAANGAGYLLGALIAAPLARRHGTWRSFFWSLLVTALALLATAVSGNRAIVFVFRLLSGAAGGITVVAGGGLVAQAGAESAPGRAALLLGLYFGGAGVGIMLSAWVVPLALTLWPGASGWRAAWILLGLAGLVATAMVRSVAQYFRGEVATQGAGQGARETGRRLYPTLLSYALFGAGYIVYMTFIVAYLDHRGAATGEITGFWTLLGGSAALSGLAWRAILGGAVAGRGIAATDSIVLAGILLPLASTRLPVILASAVLFGGSFLAVVTAVTAAARRNLEARHWTAALGYLTAAFGIGQTIGPFLAAWAPGGSDGIHTGLAVAAVLLALSTLLALLQRDHIGSSAPAPSSRQE